MIDGIKNVKNVDNMDHNSNVYEKEFMKNHPKFEIPDITLTSKNLPYGIQASNKASDCQLIKWCDQNTNGKYGLAAGYMKYNNEPKMYFYEEDTPLFQGMPIWGFFELEEDAILFKLTWG